MHPAPRGSRATGLPPREWRRGNSNVAVTQVATSEVQKLRTYHGKKRNISLPEKGGELQSESFVLSGEFLFLYTIDKNQDFLRPGSTYKISQDSSPLDITGACYDGTAKYSVALCLSNCPTKLRSRESPLGTQHRQLQYRQYNICCYYGLSLPLNGNGGSH